MRTEFSTSANQHHSPSRVHNVCLTNNNQPATEFTTSVPIKSQSSQHLSITSMKYINALTNRDEFTTIIKFTVTPYWEDPPSGWTNGLLMVPPTLRADVGEPARRRPTRLSVIPGVAGGHFPLILDRCWSALHFRGGASSLDTPGGTGRHHGQAWSSFPKSARSRAGSCCLKRLS